MINKEKNDLIQITLSKNTSQDLQMIIDHLKTSKGYVLNKSKAIEYLIIKESLKIKSNQSRKTEPKKRLNKWQKALNELKAKTKLSYPKLAEYTQVSQTSLKRFFYGELEPSESNANKLIKAFKNNNINFQ